MKCSQTHLFSVHLPNENNLVTGRADINEQSGKLKSDDVEDIFKSLDKAKVKSARIFFLPLN